MSSDEIQQRVKAIMATPEGRERAQKLLNAVFTGEELNHLDDKDIATLLENNVWARLPIMSLNGELVSQAIDRLRRASGGTFQNPPETDEEDIDLPLAAARRMPKRTHLLMLDEKGEEVGCTTPANADTMAKIDPKPARFRVVIRMMCPSCKGA